MANEEHLSILTKGVEVWNEWRIKDPNVEIDITGVDLRGKDFSDANFNGANLSNANLSEANLLAANVSEAELIKAKLNKAILIQADLRKSNFMGADLIGAYVNKANLREANLTISSALNTDFCEAILTGACIQDWNINSKTNFTDVICDYIYLRQEQQERRPSSGNFTLGEFTKLFQKSLETVDIIFRNGIDWDAFAYSSKKLEVENQGAQLDVQSIEKKGDGILVVRVAVAPDADKAKIHSDFMQGYEFATKALSAQYQARLEDKDTLIFKQETQINRLFDIVEQQGSVQKALAENPRKVSNYNMQNPQFVGGIVDANTVNADQIGGNILNNDA
ncbi:pentapeptide repeat-containing protein [Nostoc punctiforme UO1]|uniref:pentapeptide repeat-containing protein n=1 Tax=Nostoc punctiforme TaxID=272131 RepID=UPI00309D9DF9